MTAFERLTRLVLVGALLAGAAACESDMVDSEPDPTAPAIVRLVAPVAPVSVGNLITIEVTIENGFDVDDVSFHLRYGSTHATFEPPAIPGPFLSSGGASITFSAADSVPGGEVTVQLARSGASSGANGDGSLATFGFRATQAGVVPFTFVAAGLKDPMGFNRPASFVGGSVQVTP